MPRLSNEEILKTEDSKLTEKQLAKKQELLKAKEEEIPQASGPTEAPAPPAEEVEETTEEETQQEEETAEEEEVEETTSEEDNTEEEEEETTQEETNTEEEVEENLVSKIKRNRLAVDKIMFFVENLNTINTEELPTLLFLGKSWLGVLLGQLKEENPYAKEGEVKTRKDIPATREVYNDADKNKLIYDFRLKDKMFQLIELRKQLGSIIEEVSSIELSENTEVENGRIFNTARTNSFNNLSEAKFLLGKELAELKL